MDVDDVVFLVMVKRWREARLPAGGTAADRSGGAPFSEATIRCCVRKRPLLDREVEAKVFDVVSCSGQGADMGSCVLHEPREKVDMSKTLAHHTFELNGGVFGEDCTTSNLYDAAVKPLVDHVLSTPGARSTIFAYGQTGSGKTHTMIGEAGGDHGAGRELGIYALAAADLFSTIGASHGNIQASFFELYRGQLYDLLKSRHPLDLLEDKDGHVQVIGLSAVEIQDEAGLLKLIGSVARSTASTGANETSSRSHAILQIELPVDALNEVASRLTFVDLAGSEWFADQGGHDKDAQLEGAEINKSLLSLKECIRALGGLDNFGLKSASATIGTKKTAKSTETARHVPFRGSKLTRLLKDSFIGPPGLCQMLMVAQVSPASSSWEHSLNTLRYADRVGSLPQSAKKPSAGGQEKRRGTLSPKKIAGSPRASPLHTKQSTGIASPARASSAMASKTPSSGPRQTLSSGGDQLKATLRTNLIRSSSANSSQTPTSGSRKTVGSDGDRFKMEAPLHKGSTFHSWLTRSQDRSSGSVPVSEHEEGHGTHPLPPMPPGDEVETVGNLFVTELDFSRPVGLATDTWLRVDRASGQSNEVGIQVGMRVIEIGDVKVRSQTELVAAVHEARRSAPGSSRKLRVALERS